MARPRLPMQRLSDWGKWKRNQRSMPKQSCSRCGRSGNVNRHHKDQNKSNNARSNIGFLCDACHAAVHGKAVQGRAGS